MSRLFSEFRPVSELSEKMKSALLEAHGKRERPIIYDIYSGGESASACVHDGKVFTFCTSSAFIQDPGQFAIGVASWKYLYFCLMYLNSQGDMESVLELVPFISDYDLVKLIQNRQYHVVKAYLGRVNEKKEIPPSAVQESSMIGLFLDAGWYLQLDVVLQYYDLVMYRLYRESVRQVLRRWNFERDEAYDEAYRRFLELAIERGDDVIYTLLDKH